MKAKNGTFEGHETWWSNVRMKLKMHLHFIAYCMIGAIVLTIIASKLWVKSEDWYISRTYLQSVVLSLLPIRLTMEFAGQDYSAQLIRKAFASNPLWVTAKPLCLFLASSSLSYAIGYPSLVLYFKKRAKAQMKTVVVRGAELRTPEEVLRDIKKDGMKGRIPIGKLFLPIDLESYMTLVIGSPGSGKSTEINQMVVAVYGIGKSIIYDKNGDYLEKFYNPETDYIFNPLDSRSLGWNLFNELKTVMDIDAVATSLIPLSKSDADNQSFFLSGARDVFAGGLHYLWQSGARTNADVWNFVSSPATQIRAALEKTKGGERGFRYIEDASSKQALGVLAVMMQFAKSFEYMAKMSGNFSLSEWLSDGKPSRLFITNYEECKDTLRPILSLFIDLLGRKLLALPDSFDRRVYFFLDELGTLQRLSTIKDLLILSRKKGGSVFVGIQDFAQLIHIYGPEQSDTMMNGFNNIVILRCTDPATADGIAKRIGQQEVIEKRRNISWGVADNRDGTSISESEKEKLVVMGTEIMNLKNFECYTKLMGYNACKDIILRKWFQKKEYPFILRSGLSLDEVMAEDAVLREKAAEFQGEKEQATEISGKKKSLKELLGEKGIEQQTESNNLDEIDNY